MLRFVHLHDAVAAEDLGGFPIEVASGNQMTVFSLAAPGAKRSATGAGRIAT